MSKSYSELGRALFVVVAKDHDLNILRCLLDAGADPDTNLENAVLDARFMPISFGLNAVWNEGIQERLTELDYRGVTLEEIIVLRNKLYNDLFFFLSGVCKDIHADGNGPIASLPDELLSMVTSKLLLTDVKPDTDQDNIETTGDTSADD